MKNPDFSLFPELTTPRFLLRELNVADAPLIHALRSDKETNTMIGREDSNGPDDALLFINKIKKGIQINECIYWVICFENSPDLIGTVGLWNFDPSAEAAEIGYEVLRALRGQGIMSEVLPRILQFGFEEMELKLIAAFSPNQNDPSINLLKKCGFRLTSSNVDITHQEIPGMTSFVLAPLSD
jgi:ribosomal-protein-alanine N-acetyltransferase